MQTVSVDTGGESPGATKTESSASARVREWLRAELRPRISSTTHSRVAISFISASIFVLSFGVRLLHWQDSYADLARRGPSTSGLARHYLGEAARIQSEGAILYPRNGVDPGDARLIVHPPGYSAFIAGLFSVFGNSEEGLRLAQILVDAISSLMVFLIALHLFRPAIAALGSCLAAMSPHFAYYSLWITPDTLPVLPLLIAIYLICRAVNRSEPGLLIAAGAMVGLSCWLRANGLLLGAFLALATLLLFEGRKKWLYSAALLATTALVISPITVRNWLLFRKFIPISVDGGLALVEGIAAYDTAGRFGMPKTDGEALLKDVEWHNRPDYAGNLWHPDGIERDQFRFRRGLQVVRENPFWFARAMVDRSLFMLRYNDSGRADWPFGTAVVPVVSGEPGPTHLMSLTPGGKPVLTIRPADLVEYVRSPEGNVSLDSSGSILNVAGDDSEFGDQIGLVFPVKPGCDYMLAIPLEIKQGAMALKVTSSDSRYTLTSYIAVRDGRAKSRHSRHDKPDSNGSLGELKIVNMAFASGRRDEVRFVVRNNGISVNRPEVIVGELRLFELGATGFKWSRYPRLLIRASQKTLFKTKVMLPLVLIGVLLLAFVRAKRILILLLAVPVYYLCIHAVLTTEYRYILPIHYFLFIFAGVAIYAAYATARLGLLNINRYVLPGSLRIHRSTNDHPPSTDRTT